MHTDFSVSLMMDTSRRLAEMQTTTERTLGTLRTDLRLLHQEVTHYRGTILGRLDDMSKRLAVLEAKAAKPVLDLAAIWQSLWFRVALLAMLGASNKELLEIVSASFGK